MIWCNKSKTKNICE